MPTLPVERSWASRLAALSIASGIAVSVIYLPQSLLATIAIDLGVTPTMAGIAATAVQAGYALGILLLVPLADRIHPRRQVTVQSIVLAAALLASAVLPTIATVAIGFLIVGLVANIAQIVIPAASRIAPAEHRGSATSTLLGALLVGIFGGRIVASLLVDAIGWRWVVVIFAVLVLGILPFLRRALDADLPLDGERRSYPRLIVQTLRLITRSRPLAESALTQFFVFAAFIALWTIMVLHLTGPSFGWSVLGAGLFGLVGLLAGFVTPFSGRFIDRFGTLPVAGVALAFTLLATISLIVDAGNIVLLAIGMFLVTLGNQATQAGTQSRALTANAGIAARANTMFMFSTFLGGSAGAFLGSLTYDAAGMRGVAILAAGLTAAALAVWGISVAGTRRESAV